MSISEFLKISKQYGERTFQYQRCDKANYFTKAELINDRVTDTAFISILRLSSKLRKVASSRGWSKELCLEGSQSSFDREMTGAKAPKTPSLDLSPQWALRNRNKCASGRLVELSLSVYHFILFLRKLQLLTPKKLWFLFNLKHDVIRCTK